MEEMCLKNLPLMVCVFFILPLTVLPRLLLLRRRPNATNLVNFQNLCSRLHNRHSHIL